MSRACSTNGGKKNAYRILVGKPEGKRPLGRPRCRWVDNIKIDLKEIGWGRMDYTDLSQDRKQWSALVNIGSIKCWQVLEQLHNQWLLKKGSAPLSYLVNPLMQGTHSSIVG
jgi:hypothetical protein